MTDSALPPLADLRDARRIIAVRLDAMGDLLMTTPALRALRRGAPGAHLALLTSPAAADVAALLPELDEVITAEVPWMKGRHPTQVAGRVPDDPAMAAPDPTEATRALIERLAAGAYDLGVIFTVNSQSPLPAAMTLLLAGVGRRAAHCRENPYALLTTWVVEPEPDRPTRHEVRRQLDLVAALGFPADEEDHLSVRVPPSAARRVEGLLAELGMRPGDPWAVIAPGASAASRRWPPERFGAVGRTLASDQGWRLLVTGDAGERALTATVAAAIGPAATDLGGRLSLPELAALLARAPLLIANNSGSAHLAAAVGTPIVDVYALTNPQHTPWGVPNRVVTFPVPCAGCRRSVCPEGHHACMLGISPERVVAAALDLVPGREKVPA